MRISNNTVPTVNVRIADPSGKMIEDGRDPMAYLHGGYGGTLPRIEEALDGKEAGYQVTLSLEPPDAFGQRDPSLERSIPKSEFPPGVKVGGLLEGATPEGHKIAFTVVKIKGDKVLLDGNHPLAGKSLRIMLKVLDVRAATEEEIAHRHVHGAHGHQH